MNADFSPKGFERILACVAEGTTSDHAVRAAVSLAKLFEADLRLLHVVPPVFTAGVRMGGVTSEALSHSRAENVRETLRAHLAHRHAGLEFRGRPLADLLEVDVGTPARAVIERVERDHVDLVVVGDSGRRKQLDLGGLARALFSRAPCPVWMQVEPPRRVERILVPIDLSDSSRGVLDRACEIARAFGARIHVMECFVNPELYYGAGLDVPPGPLPYAHDNLRNLEREAFEKFVEEYPWRGVDHTVEFVEDDPSRAILAAQEHHDLIVMGTQGRSAIAAALLGSVTWQVLRLARTPILTVRSPQRVLAHA